MQFLLLLLSFCSFITLTTSVQTRIVGGDPVSSRDKYPFFGYWWWGCGTVLVAPDVVLTAAHCEERDFLRNFPIHFGTTRLNDRSARYEAFPIEYRIHPEHGGEGDAYDFMVMKLDRSVPLELAQLNWDSWSPFVGETLTVIGFGVQDDNSEDYSDVLLEVQVNFIGGEECKNDDLYPEYAKHNYLRPGENDVHMCAGVPEGGKDACYGDRYVLAGNT